MGLFDDLQGKAQDLIAGNEEAIRDGIEKVGDFVDAQTGGKFSSQVDLVQGAASDYVTNLEEEGGQASNTESPQQ
ncbi:antitoxin [Paenarthrobacter sp. NPDC058040]|uniref:antitoxin n=1 Tax=unclassified Paenarthrobacter TaxID=2634190 RepID=UPI0036DB5971